MSSPPTSLPFLQMHPAPWSARGKFRAIVPVVTVDLSCFTGSLAEKQHPQQTQVITSYDNQGKDSPRPVASPPAPICLSLLSKPEPRQGKRQTFFSVLWMLEHPLRLPLLLPASHGKQ